MILLPSSTKSRPSRILRFASNIGSIAMVAEQNDQLMANAGKRDISIVYEIYS